MNDNHAENIESKRLKQKLSTLEPVHEPKNDLWPDIEAQIRAEQKAPVRHWPHYAVAASILLTFLSLGFSSYLYYQQIESTQLAANYVEMIEQPYIRARALYLNELHNRQPLDTVTQELLNQNMQVIDKALSEIRQAMKDNPKNPFLMETLIKTRDKELDLLKQLTVTTPTSI